MKATRLLLALTVLIVACQPGATATATNTPTAAVNPTPQAGFEFRPRPGRTAVLGWDGVDNRVMMVAPVLDGDLHETGVGAWTLAPRGWEQMAAPPVVADEFGFVNLALAYDSARRVELLVWNRRSDTATVVTEWDGKTWRTSGVPAAPPSFGPGAYSPELHALVGLVPDGADRTWMYDGASWRQPASGSLQPPPEVTFVAYDAKNRRVVGLEEPTHATWEFDGSGWNRGPAVLPSRPGMIVTLDPQAGQWLGFGGRTDGEAPAQTWTSPLRLMPSQSSPTARYQNPGSHVAAWDPVAHRAVMFGGIPELAPETGADFDTWAWNGTTWNKLFDASPLADPSQVPNVGPCTPSTSYGLLIALGKLNLINTCGGTAASAGIAPSSVTTCSAYGSRPVSLAPPVSASNTHVYFRDGDTDIRSITPGGAVADVTRVPGGSSTVSFFSVSPDDHRIAVAVEDFSATGIGLRMYVEDLRGGGHHADIYATTLGTLGLRTLWPMGWHDGLLVLALVDGCASQLPLWAPYEWHLVDPTTGDRKVTIKGDGCDLSWWPSPAGLSCARPDRETVSYSWLASISARFQVGLGASTTTSGLSPSGSRAFATAGALLCGGIQVLDTGTCVATGPGPVVDAQHPRLAAASKEACLWIDEDHLLAGDAVIGMPLAQFPQSHYAPAKRIGMSGQCVGRFPGGL